MGAAAEFRSDCRGAFACSAFHAQHVVVTTELDAMLLGMELLQRANPPQVQVRVFLRQRRQRRERDR